MNIVQIAIDGPAGTGKSTVAKIIAKKLNITYLDTGAMYRAITLKAIEAGIDLDSQEELKSIVDEAVIDIDFETIKVNGIDCSDEIREPIVSQNVSAVAKDFYVREQMVKRQREIAGNKSVVMDGRDIGTHVLPNARFKYFLVASSLERAKRRIEDLEAKGFYTTIEELQNEIEARDKIDSEREFSPLVQAVDAKKIDTTYMTVDEVVNLILSDIVIL